MKLLKTFNSLCTPAQVYLGISMVGVISMIMQNLSNSHMYCIGNVQAPCPNHNMFYFLFIILYIAGWTFALNKLCTKGYKNVSWFLVFLPILIMFVVIGIFMLSLKH